MENEMEYIKERISSYLQVDIDQLRREIIEKAITIQKDYSKKVLLEIYGKSEYYISIIQQGYGYPGHSEFSYEFSLIEPWDVYGFEDVVYDSDEGLYIDQSNGEEFMEDELLEEATIDAISGWCGDFEYEFNRFLIEFNNFLDSLKGDRDE